MKESAATPPAPPPSERAPAGRETPAALLNLRHVRYFLVLAEELHFGRAAARLQIGQPPLSAQLQMLERQLGVRLLKRDRRSVELTEAGHAFRDEALLLMAQAERTRRAAWRADQGETGKLAIGFVPSGNHTLLMAALNRMRLECPDATVALHSMSTQAQLESALGGQIDAGFVRLPVRHQGLKLRTVSAEKLVVALPGAHPLAAQPDISIADLSDEGLLIFPRTIAPFYFDLILGLFGRTGRPLRIVQEIEHSQTLLAFVGAGWGFTLVPECFRDFHYQGVVYRPLADPTPKAAMGLIYRPENTSGLLRRFIAMLPDLD